MDNSFNNINNNNININNNLHNIDLLMLGNKGKKYNNNNNQILNEEDINNIQIILKEFKIYKKQIKNKINDLYTSFLDNSNNEIININDKINGYFYLFIQSIINNIKNENIKSSIQNELINYNNKHSKDNKDANKDINYHDILINNNNKNKNKNKNIEQYLDIKKINNVKILPKNRY